ncbi:hypothetical protein W822_02180 [Advenella kashmirensis W13003]|uniref:Uncharacterized protein n=1 Tax=Advenella kashmirensis W13003 TaxID=1424334 RepID=V8R086_9BURK|nr:hypothetical protein [Advenella kashmirensis]ETF04679.1 hypothetical protein W822_02180 [Advenella kashmirensis W13003]
MDKVSKKTAIKKFLMLQIVVALLLTAELWYFKSNYLYIAIFFIELYAVSRLENRLIKMPDSVNRFNRIYENGTDATASVIKIESTGRVTESGEYYVFTLALKKPRAQLIIEDEITDSQLYIKELATLPVRYLPDTMEAIILSEKL